jgi:hypothetical protein
MRLESEEDIRLAVDRYINAIRTQASMPPEKRESRYIPDELLLKLGCPYDRQDASGESVKIYPVLSERDLPIVSRQLPRLLVATAGQLPANISDINVLLGCLLVHTDWRDCLAEEDTAYALAVALCFFLDTETASILDILTNDEKTNILRILNEWVKPDPAWVTLPRQRVVTEILFGAPWCHFALPYQQDVVQIEPTSVSKEVMRKAIVGGQPPFMPGLCPQLSDMERAAELPSEIGGP